MPKTDARIDAYIANAAPFARPILEHLRSIVHDVCPDATETIKWSMPAFDYKGPLCSMAGFKAHCTFAFWKASAMTDPETGLPLERGEAMGHFGRITSLEDLPSAATLKKYVAQARILNEQGAKGSPAVGRTTARKTRPELPMPDDFRAALDRSNRAAAGFEKLPPSHKREYIEWISEAKCEQTREKRIATALEWLAEGKSRNWKYEPQK